MADGLKTLAKARLELEQMYMGIPDDSVDLTFQDLAYASKKIDHASSEKKRQPAVAVNSAMKIIPEVVMSPRTRSPSPQNINPHSLRLPSLDFSRGLQAGSQAQEKNHLRYNDHVDRGDGHRHQPQDMQKFSYSHGKTVTPSSNNKHAIKQVQLEMRHGVERSVASDDVPRRSMTPTGGRRRPGVPHSSICTICSTYCYFLRTRCLVCGRVYCRQCVQMGMGDMIEGRKCIECLGLRFSHRYIQRAGRMGCCGWRYPSMAKQAEVTWAEKGPRRNGDKGYGRSSVVEPSRSRSPMRVTTPRGYNGNSNINEPSFVMSSSHSPYLSPSHHHLPL